VILVDANLLIYAVNRDASHHRPARRWWEETLSGTTEVGMAWVVVLAFLRVTTRSTILEHPLDPEEALDYVSSWFRQPFVVPVSAGPDHWAVLRALLASAGTAGNLTSDAHLAALAIEQDCPVYSADNDFQRFPGVEHVNPLVAR
jgi:toxin-antitoxin system PIN domain toxin